MPAVDPRELGARIRAARGYKGLSVPVLAAGIGVSESTFKRIEEGKSSAAKRLPAIIDATGVPAEFFEVGFAPLEKPLTDVGRRVYQLEDRIGELESVAGVLLPLLMNSLQEGTGVQLAPDVVEALERVLGMRVPADHR